jgi:hypothetical protein
MMMVAGFVARIHGAVGAAAWLLGVGGSLSAIAAFCFVIGIWRTMDASPMRRINRRGRPMAVLPQEDAH